MATSPTKPTLDPNVADGLIRFLNSDAVTIKGNNLMFVNVAIGQLSAIVQAAKAQAEPVPEPVDVSEDAE